MNLLELLGEELHKQVVEKVGDRELAIVKGDGADGSWIPKEKFATVNTELGTVKAELKTRDDQLVELKVAAKGNEELSDKIATLTTANEENATKHAAALRDVKLAAALDVALLKAGARNLKATRSLIDSEGLELAEDGTVKGLDDVVKGLTESEETKFLFVAPKSDKLVGEKSAELGGSAGGKNPWKAGEVNLSEQTRLYKESPELAEKLKSEAGA